MIKIRLSLDIEIDPASYEENYGITGEEAVASTVGSDVESVVQNYYERCGVSARVVVR